jgi:hypothetical protein
MLSSPDAVTARANDTGKVLLFFLPTWGEGSHVKVGSKPWSRWGSPVRGSVSSQKVATQNCHECSRASSFRRTFICVPVSAHHRQQQLLELCERLPDGYVTRLLCCLSRLRDHPPPAVVVMMVMCVPSDPNPAATALGPLHNKKSAMHYRHSLAQTFPPARCSSILHYFFTCAHVARLRLIRGSSRGSQSECF